MKAEHHAVYTGICSSNAPLQSLDICVTVIDLGMTKTLRVSHSDNVGSFMEQLVGSIDLKKDWSKHRLWYPKKKKWLIKPRATLGEYDLTFNCKLQFIQTIYNVNILLPDLQFYSTTVDLTKTIFAVTKDICDEIGIQHFEELSLMKSTEQQSIAAVASRASVISRQCFENTTTIGHRQRSPGIAFAINPGSPRLNDSTSYSRTSSGFNGSCNSLPTTPLRQGHTHTRTTTGNGIKLLSPPSQTLSASTDPSSTSSLISLTSTESQLINSPYVNFDDAVKSGLIVIPKSTAELATSYSKWFDDSLSLIEQELFDPGDNVFVLSYKFATFFQLSSAIEPVRLNQIYHFSKWSILGERVHCTLNDAISLAALQLHIHILYTNPSQRYSTNLSVESEISYPSTAPATKNGGTCDEIDDLLNQLQMDQQPYTQCDKRVEIDYIPELQTYLKVHTKKSSKNAKKMWVVVQNTRLRLFKSKDSTAQGPPQIEYSLVRCELSQLVDWEQNKFDVLLNIVSPFDGTVEEVRFRFNNVSEFSEWVTAFQLAAENRTLASREMFINQSKRHREQLQVQQKARNASQSKIREFPPDFSIVDCMPSYIIRKNKPRVLVTSILEAHNKLGCLPLFEAKMQYINDCQRITDWGVSYVTIRQKDSKKEELLGIRASGIFLANSETKEKLKIWKYTDIQKFTPNKDNGCITVLFTDKKFEFFPVVVGWKTVCELIGGNIFMNLRVSNKPIDPITYFSLTAASGH